MQNKDYVEQIFAAYGISLSYQDFLELQAIDFAYEREEATMVWEALATLAPVGANYNISIADLIVTLRAQYNGVNGCEMRKKLVMEHGRGLERI